MSSIQCPHCGETLEPVEIEAGLSLVCAECDEPDPERRSGDPWSEPPETAHWFVPPVEKTRR